MPSQVYRDLLEVMKGRGGPYAGLDIPEFFALVETIFEPQEAEINNVLTRKPASVDEIAAKSTRDKQEVMAILEAMASKGLCGIAKSGGNVLYRGLPFMPGIFEFLFIGSGESEREKTIAHLIWAYKKAHAAVLGVEKIGFPHTRVITVTQKIKFGNKIHTYDQVMTYIDKYDAIGIGACYCRQAAKLRGEDLHGMPVGVCMWFGETAKNITERLGGRRVSKEEAREIITKSEEAGLIHMSRNTSEEIDFMCNCDRWHCEVVGNVLKQPKPGQVFNSGFVPSFDGDLCISCGLCVERCPPEALTMEAVNQFAVNLDRCFGCGVCATGCPEGAITMETKVDFPPPPKTTRDLVQAMKDNTTGLKAEKIK